MGPALDIRPLELEDEPVPKRDRMVKPMTKKECSILTKVFDEASHYDVPRGDPASPTGHSKAGGPLAQSFPAPMEAVPSFSTTTASSPIGTNSTISVTQASSPCGSQGEQSTDGQGRSSLKRKADDEELTRRLWQKYPAVMQALEQPSIMDMVVNEAPGKKSQHSSPRTPTKGQKTPKRTPQGKSAKKPRSRKRASKKGTSCPSTNEFVNMPPEMPMDSHGYEDFRGTPYLYPSPFSYETAQTPSNYPWPPYPYLHPGTASPSNGTDVSGQAATPFYPLPYPQHFDPLPSVNTLLPFPSLPSCDPLPVLDLSSDDLDHFHPDCSPSV